MSEDESILETYSMKIPDGFDEWPEDAQDEYLRMSYHSLNLGEKRQAIAEYYGHDLKSSETFRSKTLTHILVELYDDEDLTRIE